ncbi:unnamed protein product [Fraxinus pennsylvanica]|uniref:cellulase n=1 Tax=Fraxinus pennsylvanica TaxID=56036 RepID=A0AAD1ZNL1_9LAMI|nr:unnamed protein product [Fraxinus pennsylvanica]
MARKYHPDVSPPGRMEEYTQRFIQVHEAYETLSDPGRRASYDLDMAKGLHLAFSTKRHSKFDEVGDTRKDHACWERPEDMDTPRIFKRSDPTYSKLLARRAIRVFQFADKYRGAYSNGLKPYVCPYYCDFSFS